MKTLSLGKYRKLQQCSSQYGVFSVLALDHRKNLRFSLDPKNPERVPISDMVDFKQEVVHFLATSSTAVLLGPEVGIAQCTTNGDLPGSKGLISSLEATGYVGHSTGRKCEILPGWSIAKAQRFGVSGIKLLVYYHPKSSTASSIKELVHIVAEECKKYELPLFLEPLSYNHKDGGKILEQRERYEVVLETANQLTNYDVDILKAEFPLGATSKLGGSDWVEACAALTSASKTPWVLLSASVDFEVYLRQLTIACQHGASGAVVGRAVWKEATNLVGSERAKFLKNVAHQRMERVTSLCNAIANPWTNYYKAPEITHTWYKKY
jgi:tagatose 1,6-diphosphate aldolase